MKNGLMVVARCMTYAHGERDRRRVVSNASAICSLSLIVLLCCGPSDGSELFVVTGRTWAVSGEPLSGIHVGLFASNLVALSVSDKNGAYQISNTCEAAHCEYRLRALKSGHLFEPDSYQLAISPGERVHMDFKEIAGGIVSGRVMRADGSPIKALTVTAYSKDNGTLMKSAITDDDGQYGFYLREGSARILPEPGAEDHRFAAPMDVIVVATTAVLNVDFIAQLGARIAGSIRDSDGSAWRETVLVILTEKSPEHGFRAVASRHIYAGKGEYSFSGLPPGDYWIRITCQESTRELRTNVVLSLGQIVTNADFVFTDETPKSPTLSDTMEFIRSMRSRLNFPEEPNEKP